MTATIPDRLAQVREQIAEACRAAGRSASEVELIAVSKRRTAAEVLEALEGGQLVFGENYLQEAREKQDELARLSAPLADSVVWHMIGGLQSNKARQAAGRFAVIQGLDSLTTAKRLAAAARESGVAQSVYIQIKLGSGATRSGVLPEDAPSFVEQAAALKGLRLDGVMGVAPAPGEAVSGPRRHFERLRLVAENLRSLALPTAPLTEISAGMSGDFPDAILEGATVVRIGTAIFGERSKQENV